MSRVTFVRGRALNSDQLQAFIGLGPTRSVNLQFSSAIRGVGPADSIGKPSVRCCPGGMRFANPPAGVRPVKPLVTILGSLLSVRATIVDATGPSHLGQRRDACRCRRSATPCVLSAK